MRRSVREKISECSGCGACLHTCPYQAISLKADGEGFFYPEIDASKCVDCGLCEKKCPFGKTYVCEIEENLGGQCRDIALRLQSSSGGVFTILANAVVKRGGVVFGSVMSDSRHVEIIGAISEKDISLMRGSKYVQSFSADAIVNARDLVNRGMPVLFTGAPCQVAGLLSLFKGKKPNKLITVDFVCHGVPSPSVFSSYISTLEKEQDSSIIAVDFRSKEKGWTDFHFRADFENGTSITGDQKTNIYLRGFLNNLYLRPSCHNCTFRGNSYLSDITIGDLWGAQNIYPEKNDDTGLSLIRIHTKEGRKFFKECGGMNLFKISNLKPLTRYNPSIEKSVPPHKNRQMFFKKFSDVGFSSQLVERCLREPGRLSRTANRISHLPAGAVRRLKRLLRGK